MYFCLAYGGLSTNIDAQINSLFYCPNLCFPFTALTIILNYATD